MAAATTLHIPLQIIRKLSAIQISRELLQIMRKVVQNQYYRVLQVELYY